MPPGNYAISYSTFGHRHRLSRPHRVFLYLGEPAIMVQSGTAYLAASCFNDNLFSDGIFILPIPSMLKAACPALVLLRWSVPCRQH